VLTKIPMSLGNVWILGSPLVLGLAISCGSALFSIRTVRSANPADLFR
jgi:hypothetical protein